jgi:glycosyltransferase involved in cell wall biosynthesis
MPFSKNQFIINFFKRDTIINDFFISKYDTYVFDRQKITKINPRAWLKYLQDWINFRFSNYLLSDTMEHFNYWEKLFGKFKGKHLVLPVLAETDIYYPSSCAMNNDKIKILFYGSFIPLHGIDIILDAFYLMEKNNINFEARIVGNGQTYNKMKILYDKLELKNVKMTGEIMQEKDLANLIRECDIILGIFGNSKKAKSVIPNKVYQSTACKKCTVTMNSNVLKEFYRENDLVTCENSANDLSETLISLIENKSRITYVAENGFKRFQNIYLTAEKDFKKFIESVDKSNNK